MSWRMGKGREGTYTSEMARRAGIVGESGSCMTELLKGTGGIVEAGGEGGLGMLYGLDTQLNGVIGRRAEPGVRGTM